MKRKQLTNLMMCILMTGFLLGIYRGKVALWKDDDPAPYKVFPIPASQISQPARGLLERGIPLESMDQLTELIEKYLG